MIQILIQNSVFVSAVLFVCNCLSKLPSEIIIIFRCKRMVQMPWLMKKIVCFSFRIVQGAKLQNFPFSFS